MKTSLYNYNRFYKAFCFLCFFIAVLLLFQNPVAAQAPDSIRINTLVVDSITHKPMPAVSLQLKKNAGKNVIHAITDTNGTYSVFVDNTSSYTLIVSAVGYVSKTIQLPNAISSISANKRLDTIFLSPQAKALNNVVVMGSRPVVRQEADRIIYDLQADPDSKSNSVWEMMRKVPFLSVDGQDNILLKGSNSYRIFINGKPSGMVERNPREVLRSIPAATIVSIEVITTPSAKYDAEGLAGIINIITVKKIDNGYSGNINGNTKFLAGGPGAGGYFAFKNGKLGASVLGGASWYHNPQTNIDIDRHSIGENNTFLNQNGVSKSSSRNTYLGTEWSYEIDSLHLLSAQFNLNDNRGDGAAQQRSLLTNGGAAKEQYLLTNNNNNSGNGVDAGLNYQIGFKKNKNQLLTFSYRYLGSTNTQDAVLHTTNILNYPYPDYKQNNTGRTSENTLQADYVQQVKKWAMEAGIKAILRNNNSDYQYAAFDSARNAFLPDLSQANTYENKQQIWSAYNTWQTAIKSWSIKAGVRLEQTNLSADFMSTASGVQQHYLSIIPAAVVNKKWSNNSSLGLSYTRRIQRPGINYINPFINRSNPNFITTGNPDLKPAYTDVLQLSYLQSKKYTINIAIGCMLINDLVSRFADYDAATGITLTTYRNVGAVAIYKSNIYFSYPITKQWSVRLNSDIRYINAELNTAKGKIENKAWSVYANTATSYQWSTGWRINADLTLNSRNTTSVQSSINGFALLNCNLQKEIKSKLTLTATIQNPFAKYRYNREHYFGPDFDQTTTSQIYYRSFGFSVNYRFGKLKEAVKKSKRSIKNDDGD